MKIGGSKRAQRRADLRLMGMRYTQPRDARGFTARVELPRWPPFFSTPWLRPRLVVVLVNEMSEDLAMVALSGKVARHEGPMPASADEITGWRSFGIPHIGDLPRGGRHAARVDLPRSLVPTEGLYVFGLEVHTNRESTMGAEQSWLESLGYPRLAGRSLDPLETSEDALAQLDPEDAARFRSLEQQVREARSNPGTRVQRTDLLLDLQTLDFVRVEPFINLLTFLLALGTVLMAIATVALALRPSG
jgi:hypothetical protein